VEIGLSRKRAPLLILLLCNHLMIAEHSSWDLTLCAGSVAAGNWILDV
jgi:hypothetical protein